MAFVDFNGENPPNSVPLPSTLALIMTALLSGLRRLALAGMFRPQRA